MPLPHGNGNKLPFFYLRLMVVTSFYFLLLEYNINIFVLISGVQQNDSIIHIHIFIIFQILFSYRLLQNIE